jgi:hypothetical protein
MNELEFTHKDASGKTHKVSIDVFQAAAWDGCASSRTCRVVASINGESFLGIYPVDVANVRSAAASLKRGVKSYLDGQHHPTQYTGQFSHLAEISSSLRS